MVHQQACLVPALPGHTLQVGDAHMRVEAAHVEQLLVLALDCAQAKALPFCAAACEHAARPSSWQLA
jgi:hypothetical protein